MWWDSPASPEDGPPHPRTRVDAMNRSKPPSHSASVSLPHLRLVTWQVLGKPPLNCPLLPYNNDHL